MEPNVKSELQLRTHRYLGGKLSPEEAKAFEELLKTDKQAMEVARPLMVLYLAIREEEKQVIRERWEEVRKKKRIPIQIKSLAAAVVLLFLVGLGLFLMFRPHHPNWASLAEEYLGPEPTIDAVLARWAAHDPQVPSAPSEETVQALNDAYDYLWTSNFGMVNSLFSTVLDQDAPLTGWGMLMAGLSALYGGEAEKSLSIFERVADSSDAFPPALYYRSLAYLELLQPDEAHTLLLELKTRDPSHCDEVSEILSKIEKWKPRDD